MGTFSNPVKWILDIFGGSNSTYVSEKSALGVAPLWYGVNKISGNVGTLPLKLMEQTDQGKVEATDHPAHSLLMHEPNGFQTPIAFKQSLTQHAVLWGNGRAYIRREAGRPVELIPIMPDRTITGMVDGEKFHCTYPHQQDHYAGLSAIPELIERMQTNPDGVVTVSDRDVIHIQGFGHGVSGMSLVEVARTSLEVSMGADKRAARQMQKGFAGRVMLEAPEGSAYFRDETLAKEFLEAFRKEHNTDESGNQVGLLREGVTANVLQMSNRDAEFIEQRQFQREEIGHWLGIDNIPYTNNSVSYNSESQKSLAYLKNCLNTWLVRWRQECAKKLLTPKERNSGRYCFEFDSWELLRPDFESLSTTVGSLVADTILNPNEARELLNRNPRPGGEVFSNPNTTPGGTDQPTNDEPAEPKPAKPGN